jgi:hypothetical protein
MSLLEFWARPLVAFDATNKEHRAIYNEFVKYRGWGKSPYRFIVPDVTSANLPSMIQQKMLDYYVQKEFRGVAEKPQPKMRPKPLPVKTTRKAVQKAKKMVDKKKD